MTPDANGKIGYSRDVSNDDAMFYFFFLRGGGFSFRETVVVVVALTVFNRVYFCSC